MKYLKFLATTLAIIVSASVYAQTQNTPRRFDDSTGVRPWTGNVQLGVPIDQNLLPPSNGAGNWCGMWHTAAHTDFYATRPVNINGAPVGPLPTIATISHQPCQGYNLNAGFPNPKCPPNYKLTPLNGSWVVRTRQVVIGWTPQGDSGSGTWQYDNVPYGDGITGTTFTCMLQPTNAPVWVQNIGYEHIGFYTGCDYSIDSNPCLFTIPNYTKKEIFSDGTIIDFGPLTPNGGVVTLYNG